MILIISSTSSFEMAKVAPSPAHKTHYPCTFVWIGLYIKEVNSIVTNGARIFLAKGTSKLQVISLIELQ